MEKTYKIVRCTFKSTGRRTIKTGLTLEQAQAHCERDDTHGPGWFDAFIAEEN